MFVLNTFGESNFDAISIYELGINYIYAATDSSLLLVISVSYFWKSELAYISDGILSLNCSEAVSSLCFDYD
jgi:hypothetical protein